MMQRVAIILPTKGNRIQLEHCVKSLISSTSYPNYRIIIIDSDEVHPLDPINTLKKTFPIKIVKTDEIGINIKAINIGIKETEEDEDVLLIHDDMQFFKLYKRDWLYELANCPKGNVGMITYLGNIKESGKDYLAGLKWIGSWFCYIPRNTINKVGIMDESFNIGEDIDYAYRVQKAELVLGEVDFWFEHHQIRSTRHNDQSEEIKTTNAKRFKEKHGIT